MKVGDFLSGATVTGSRTLTIYSATVLAVAWTNTPLEKLPGIGWLSDNDQTRYVIMLLVLLFMAASFTANWLNDYYAVYAQSAYENFKKNSKMRDATAHATQYLNKVEHKSLTNDPTSDRAHLVLKLTRIQRWTNFAVRYGFHLIVPSLLAAVAGLAIAVKLHY